MAVVNKFMQEEQKRLENQQQAARYSTFNTKPVSADNRAAMQITTPAKTYKLGKNPGNYKSRFSGTLDNIMNQILNPEEFKYEFNGDEMFRNYADLYTQYAKRGMLDTMGQAVGMTGGYGNSYAQQVGQQSYQENILPLYDRGFDLRNMAYQGYRDDMGDLKDAYNAMMQNEQYDYSQYNNAVNAYMQQQQIDAMAAAARARGGGGPGPKTKETPEYYVSKGRNGDYRYKVLDKDGKYKSVSRDEVNKNPGVMYDYYEAVYGNKKLYNSNK